ncbi:MAG: hypothetical protein HKP61_04365 [Dactylosporangium sp.]|nr:ECF transporter S component [Dactylosporangium sp.]NNJ60187.1 hypothetical protein [Dactylosporangium sp.]
MASIRSTLRWRTVDIIVVAVLAAAFGVVFWAWNNLWAVSEGLFAFFKPAQALLYGVWLLPAVLGGLIVRRPGAALGCEAAAAAMSALLGNQWGMTVILQGLVEGLACELVFLIVLYRLFTLPVAALAGASAGLGATLYDAIVWYPGTSWASLRLPYIAFGTTSSLLIAGVGGWFLVAALARTGVLDRFAAGRNRAAV